MRALATGLIGIGLASCAPVADSGLAMSTDVEVTMNCRVIADGALDDCRVTRERPAGYGMAAEAILAAEEGRVRTQPVSGSPRATTGSRVTGTRISVTSRLAINAAAMARYRARTTVSEPHSAGAGE